MRVILVLLAVPLSILILHRLMFRGKSRSKVEPIDEVAQVRAPDGDVPSVTGSAQIPAPAAAAQPYRLRGEPFVMESGPFSVELKVQVGREKAALMNALDACGAFGDDWPENAFRDAFLERVPDELLTDLLMTEGQPERISLVLNGGRPILGLLYCYGTPANLEEKLIEFLDAPPGWFEMTGERGDFAGGKYFTADYLLDIEGDEVPGSLGIRVISRDRLRCEVRRTTAPFWQRLDRAGVPFSGALWDIRRPS